MNIYSPLVIPSFPGKVYDVFSKFLQGYEIQFSRRLHFSSFVLSHLGIPPGALFYYYIHCHFCLLVRYLNDM